MPFQNFPKQFLHFKPFLRVFIRIFFLLLVLFVYRTWILNDCLKAMQSPPCSLPLTLHYWGLIGVGIAVLVFTFYIWRERFAELVWEKPPELTSQEPAERKESIGTTIAKSILFPAFCVLCHQVTQLVLVLIFQVSPSDPQKNDLTLLGNFIEWFGVLYGLLFAAILVEVWSQFKQVENDLDREADLTASLYETVSLVDIHADQKTQTANREFLTNAPHTPGDLPLELLTEPKDQVSVIIRAYTKHVINNYFAEQCSKEDKRSSAQKTMGDSLLTGLRIAVSRLIYKRTEEQIINTQIVDLLTQLFDTRGDRIAHAQQRVPTELKILLVVSSVLWVTAFFALPFTEATLGVMVQLSVIYVVYSLIQIAFDLNDPYTGTWRIELDSWIGLDSELSDDNVKEISPESISGWVKEYKQRLAVISQ